MGDQIQRLANTRGESIFSYGTGDKCISCRNFPKAYGCQMIRIDDELRVKTDDELMANLLASSSWSPIL